MNIIYEIFSSPEKAIFAIVGLVLLLIAILLLAVFIYDRVIFGSVNVVKADVADAVDKVDSVVAFDATDDANGVDDLQNIKPETVKASKGLNLIADVNLIVGTIIGMLCIILGSIARKEALILVLVGISIIWSAVVISIIVKAFAVTVKNLDHTDQVNAINSLNESLKNKR